MTPEELEEYYLSIPEWKRGALTITDNQQDDEETKGIFKRMRSKIGSKIQETDQFKNF